MASRLPLIAVLGLVALGCKTITEELPSSPTTGGGTPVVNVPLPVEVKPVEIPVPQGPLPADPSPTTPAPTSAPATSEPEPEGGDGDGEDIPNNNSPVARVTAKVFFVECGGQAIPESGNSQTAEVGCRVHLDTTAKDASGRPTRARGTPRWVYSDTSAFTIGGNNPYTPVLTITQRGSTSIYSVIDGVQSNSFFIRFQ